MFPPFLFEKIMGKRQEAQQTVVPLALYGRGARIRTLDTRVRAVCLTAWRHPCDLYHCTPRKCICKALIDNIAIKLR